jgi:PAS domain S-box-containing protein
MGSGDRDKSGEQFIQAWVGIRHREADLRALEKELQHFEWTLRELWCLSELSDIAEIPEISLHAVYQEAANLVPKKCQYPNIACCKITLGNKEFKSENYKETEWKQSADIEANNRAVGKIQINYLEKRAITSEGPFLKEEESLLTAVAHRLGRITERKWMEIDLNERIAELEHFEWMVKEAECLSQLADIAETPGVSLDNICQEAANLVPMNFHYPDIACCKIALGNKEFKSENYKETEWKQSADIEAKDTIVGRVQVNYLEERPAVDEGPFLREERLFLDAVARRLGRIIERKQAEKTLQETERRLSSFVDSATDGWVLLDSHLNCTQINKAALNMLGQSNRERVIGKNIRDIAPDLSDNNRYEEYMGVIKTGEPLLVETRIAHPKIGDRHLAVKAFKIGDGLGIIIADITELKRVQDDLEERIKQMQCLYSIGCIADSPSIALDEIYQEVSNLVPKSYQYPDIACCRITIDGKEFGTQDYEETEWEQSAAIKANGIAVGKIQVNYLAERPVIDEGPFLRGERLLLEAIADQLGKIIERKWAEASLQESEKHYRALAENVNDVLFVLDMNMTPTYLSPSITRLLGYSAGEAMACGMEELLTASSLLTAKEAITKALEAEKDGVRDSCTKGVLELEMKCKDGSTVWTESTARFVRDTEGRPVGLIGTARNVTQRRERTEAEKREIVEKARLASRMASVHKMASGIAREIGDPLSTVTSFAGLLMKKDIPEDIKGDVEVIHEVTQQVLNKVKTLLCLTSQRSSQQKRVNINDIIENTLALQAQEMHASNIQVITRLQPDLPSTIAEASQVQQAFLDLIASAEIEMKTAHGKGNLFIKTETIDGFVRISFKDDGSGMTTEKLQTVFDPLSSANDEDGKTGVDLSLCRRIITENGGRIYAQSKPGQGATFIVELPIVSDSEESHLLEQVAD